MSHDGFDHGDTLDIMRLQAIPQEGAGRASEGAHAGRPTRLRDMSCGCTELFLPNREWTKRTARKLLLGCWKRTSPYPRDQIPPDKREWGTTTWCFEKEGRACGRSRDCDGWAEEREYRWREDLLEIDAMEFDRNSPAYMTWYGGPVGRFLKDGIECPCEIALFLPTNGFARTKQIRKRRAGRSPPTIFRSDRRSYNPTSDFARMLVWISDVPPMMENARELR
jgi:hypothetical protein